MNSILTQLDSEGYTLMFPDGSSVRLNGDNARVLDSQLDSCQSDEDVQSVLSEYVDA